MAILVIGCSVSFAKNHKKPIAEKPAPSVDYEKKIEEQNVILDSIKTELEKGREKLRQLQNQEGSVVAQLEQVEANIATSQSYLHHVSTKIDSVSESITHLGNQLDSAGRELALRQAAMKKRLRAMYKTGPEPLPRLMLSSASISAMLHRARYYSELSRYDRQLMASIAAARARIAGDKESLEKEKKKLAGLKKAKESEYATFVDEQESREKLLAEVRSQKESYVKMITELETAEKQVQNIVAALESKRKTTRTPYEKSLNAAFEKRRGSLPWPVDGTVVNPFGRMVHAVYKTVTMNTGIDISASKGEKVRCVAPGRVAYIGWMRGLGKLVIVDHGGYYTTYARLEETLVAKDAKVETGTVVGLVGESQTYEETKLHFEIRKSTEAMDPAEWLEKKRK
ncbi:MAG TPA: peptidoglycan DD-metalloendopeptidase family protein [Chitinivibrionales bacterium]|nr:peptidoglycan DD-metalloendopeptidase family protein [Chitinivibrionales bacterium]